MLRSDLAVRGGGPGSEPAPVRLGGDAVRSETPVRAAAYARVSTTDQTCDLQLRELREYIARRGWTACGEYVDTGFSGARASRPALDRLMADAGRHEFDCVLVW